MPKALTRFLVGFAAALMATSLPVHSPGLAAGPRGSIEAPNQAVAPQPVIIPGVGAQAGTPVPRIEWARIFGSKSVTEAFGLAPDGTGGVYVGGDARRSFAGQTNPGADSPWVARYDATGRERWTRIFGSAREDAANAVASDGSGGVYLAGETQATFGGQSNPGGLSPFVVRYDRHGHVVWTRIFGTTTGDEASAVVADGSGGVYVAGDTLVSVDDKTNSFDTAAVVTHFDGAGGLTWTRMFGGSATTAARALATDGLGGVYVAGYTTGSFDGQTNPGKYSAFLSHFDASGQRTWTRIEGSSDGEADAYALAADGNGGVYVAGRGSGSLEGTPQADQGSLLLMRYDASGQRLWSRIFGSTASDEIAYGVATDESHQVYVTGFTIGSFGGQTNPGDASVFLTRFKSSGGQKWTRIFGSKHGDVAHALTSDGTGALYLAGVTVGSFDGQRAPGLGGSAFLVRYATTRSHQVRGVASADRALVTPPAGSTPFP